VFECITFTYTDGVKSSETWELFDNNISSMKTVDTYENGFIVKSEEYFDEELFSTLTYTYEFDVHGNWTSQVITKNGLEFRVARRTLAYY
jgi:hypothetical protein